MADQMGRLFARQRWPRWLAVLLLLAVAPLATGCEGDVTRVNALPVSTLGTELGFNAPYLISTPAQPLTAALADFNGDGANDLAVTTSGDRFVSLYYGNDNGLFSGPVLVATTDSGLTVVTADINGDGSVDLLVFGSGANSMEVLLGVGDYRFTSVYYISGIGNAPVSPVVADFDRDGNSDVAFGNGTDVTIRLGNGDGTFLGSITISIGDAVLALATANFDNVNGADLAVGNDNGEVEIHTNDGSGGFSLADTVTDTTGNPADLAVADFDEDGDPDLAVADAGASQLVIHIGVGDGTLNAGTTAALGAAATAIATGDINGDNNEDVVAGSSGTNDVSVVRGNGDGTFVAADEFAVGSNDVVDALTGDFDGNSRDDFAVLSSSVFRISIGRGSGSSVMIEPDEYTVGDNPGRVAIGQITSDQDADPDAVCVNSDDNTVSYLENDGDGTFSVSSDSPGGTTPADILLADINDDTELAYVTANTSSGDVSIVEGDGSGNFATPATVSVASALAVALGDFSSGSEQDLVVIADSSSTITLLFGNGSGGFPTTSTETSAGNPTAVAAGRLTNDTNDDVAVAFASSVEIWQGDGAGDLTLLDTIAISGTPTCMALVFLDGDTERDILVGTDTGLWVLRSTLDFADPQLIPVGSVLDIASADLTNDGRVDLAIVNDADEVVIATSNGSTFLIRTRFYVANASGIAAGDVNGDGNPDLLVTRGADDRLSVLFGR